MIHAANILVGIIDDNAEPAGRASDPGRVRKRVLPQLNTIGDVCEDLLIVSSLVAELLGITDC